MVFSTEIKVAKICCGGQTMPKITWWLCFCFFFFALENVNTRIASYDWAVAATNFDIGRYETKSDGLYSIYFFLYSKKNVLQGLGWKAGSLKGLIIRSCDL